MASSPISYICIVVLVSWSRRRRLSITLICCAIHSLSIPFWWRIHYQYTSTSIELYIPLSICKSKATSAYLSFFLANIHNLSPVTNFNTFNKSAALPFALSISQSIDQRSNPLITFTVDQCASRRGSLEGGISEMRCVIAGDDDRAEVVRFSVLL